MSEQARRDSAIAEWLRLAAPEGAPAGLLEGVVEGTAGVRQTTVGFGFAMSDSIRLGGRARLAVVVISILAVLAAIMLGIGRSTPPDAETGLIALRSGGQLRLIDLDAGHVSVLPLPSGVLDESGQRTCPAIRPDGSAIAYREWDPETATMRLVVASFEGNDPIVLEQGAYDVDALVPIGGTVSWSPDGALLAARLLVVDREGGNFWNGPVIHDLAAGTVASRGGLPGGDMSWSPDGRYLTAAPFSNAISVVEVATNERRFVRLMNNPSSRPAAWSPDSRRLAFGDLNVATGFRAIFIAGIDDPDIDDPDIFEVTQGERVNTFGPTWSRDGRWLLYNRINGSATVLRLHDLETGVVREVGETRAAFWSPAGGAFASIVDARVTITDAVDLTSRVVGNAAEDEICAWLPGSGHAVGT